MNEVVIDNNTHELINSTTLNNSLSSLTYSLGASVGQPVQLSRQDTLIINTSWLMISNNRNLLSQAYVQHGIIQTLVDQPVDDAFRKGFEIKTGVLDGEDIESLQVFCKRHNAITAIMQASKWARLFGGGAVLIITEDDPKLPLNVKSLKKGSRVAFKAVDMWELYNTLLNVNGEIQFTDENQTLDSFDGDFYDYYGKKIHKSRVLRIAGKQAPSLVRPRLRGWGMSELERVIRSLNQYLKNQDVVFDLLDEAKVDIFKMKGFNSALMTQDGTVGVSKRVQHANTIKNYQNALTMDKDDEYEQKQINFTGLAEILEQIRQGVAADLKMPLTKLFGVSSAGFNSGEDDIENYNSMIEGEVQAKVEFMVIDVLQICCQVLFGFMPDDLMITFKPLRVLSSEQEETVKEKQFNRVREAYTTGLIDAQQAKQSINKGALLPTEIDEDNIANDFEDADNGDV